MGTPMAKKMVEWPGGLTIYDIRPEAMTLLAERGALQADSVADVAAADIISVTVLDDEQVRDGGRRVGGTRQARHHHRDSLHDQRHHRGGART